MSTTDNLLRCFITVTGRVQGVGFRPFIFHLASHHGLLGYVSNTTEGVEIDVQGPCYALEEFIKMLKEKRPKGAYIDHFDCKYLPLGNSTEFTIQKSQSIQGKSLALLPDTALCKECLFELNDPSNRRYKYPFIHCMSCGPRFTLFEKMPFDRENTSMRDFAPCELCLGEYQDTNNRRFYSQTICCKNCGPKLSLTDSTGVKIAEDINAIERASDLLKAGKIIACKNTGGYLLLASASCDKTIARLRDLKKRPHKPLAMLIPSIEYLEQIAHASLEEKKILQSPEAPIVLVRKKETSLISKEVSNIGPYFGVMLPHSPLQHLLIDLYQGPLVATSGNISSSPICITEEEAFHNLNPICDFFLIHTRRIIHRADDSIVCVIATTPTLFRRARGYVPSALRLTLPVCEGWILAAGGHMKNTFALGSKDKIYLSQHIGDLSNKAMSTAYQNEILSWQELMQIQPQKAVSDTHPGYESTRYLEKKGLPFTSIQHHHAHTYSGMLENQISSPFLSICWDGTGYGDDGTIWGGEAFIYQNDILKRFATFYPFDLLGGDRAIYPIKKQALSLLLDIFDHKKDDLWFSFAKRHFSAEQIEIHSLAMQKNINTIKCSSVGRLFDIIASLLDLCHTATFEAQGPLMLEELALQGKGSSLKYEIPCIEKEIFFLDYRPMIKAVLQDILCGEKKEHIAFSFHRALAEAILSITKKSSLSKVLLTGGVMQNALLIELSIQKLQSHGITPYRHSLIPPGDGGLAVGQIYGSYLLSKRS